MELLTLWLIYVKIALYHRPAYYIERKILQMNDQVWTSISNRFGLGGGFFTVLYGWVTNAETAILIGVIATIGGFIMSFYFQRRKNSRERNEYALREQVIKREEERKEEIHREMLKQFRGADYE